MLVETMRAAVAEKGRLVIRDVSVPVPRSNEALVAVRATSLNRGETKTALMPALDGFRPGWDAAGVIVKAAADGSSPREGTRVVGLAPAGAWSELAVFRSETLAPLPDAVSFADAACLPVAGLTALHALRKGGLLAARDVLVTGATGGVGTFAVQMGRAAGATVTAAIRDASQAAFVRELGARHTIIGADLAGVGTRYDLIVESVGGQVLERCMNLLVPGGICVLLGASESAGSNIDMAGFRVGGTSLYGLVMQYELLRDPPRNGLPVLLRMITEGTLKPVIGRRAPFEAIDAVAQDLMGRAFGGKAVLTLEQESGR